MIAFGNTDVGKIRTNNEDTIYLNTEGLGRLPNLFVVADGMGGHNAGEIASSLAVSAFCDYIKNNDDFAYIQDFLSDALVIANRAVHNDAKNNQTHAGMGTTFSACTFDESNIYFTHVGDSRIYIIDDKGFQQITHDHSLVADMVVNGDITSAEARIHPKKNVVTRAVGTDLHVIIDKGYLPFKGVKYVLLCSDGLTDMICDDEIMKIIQTKDDIASKIDKLIAAALEAGGDDNISVILIGWVKDES